MARRGDKPNHSVISEYQFGAGSRVTSDPQSDTRKPKFSGSTGSKTMRISGGHLPAPQTKHRHHRHNAPRSLRAR